MSSVPLVIYQTTIAVNDWDTYSARRMHKRVVSNIHKPYRGTDLEPSVYYENGFQNTFAVACLLPETFLEKSGAYWYTC